MPRDDQIDRELFLTMLTDRFPEVAAALDDIDDGLIHLEVAAFRRCVEEAIDQGKHWNVEKYLAFLQEILPMADPSLENALEVSFIEDFALGSVNDMRKTVVRDRAPKRIREKIIEVNNEWR